MSETPMKKQALLIGINEYQILPGLKYARQDAEAIANSLKQNYCFSDNEVIVLTDAEPLRFKPTSRYIIQDHLDNLANQELDLFIFGFWGHGLIRNGKRYLCPLDVMANRVENQGLPFDELQELLAKIKAKNTCLILDCCQTNHDQGEEETLTVSDQKTIENAVQEIVQRRKEQFPDSPSNVAILNSCKEGQSAYEWDACQHGLFTAYLLDAMKKRSNSVKQIANYISSNIEKTASELDKEQTPFCKLEGDIVLPVETKSTPLVTGDVFISYRHCNADLVAPVEAELKRLGISYFIDRIGINYGMDYSEALTIAIEECKLLLLFWTPEVKGSDDIINEVVLAQKLKKTVVPYKIGNFSEVEHRKLCYHIARLSAYSVSQQTADTIREIVNKVELELTGKVSEPIIQPPPEQESPKPKPSENGSGISTFIADKIKQLEKDALDAISKEDYKTAIPKLEEILVWDSNFTDAQSLLAHCNKKIEERNRRETEEAERERRKAEQRAAERRKAGERKTVTVNDVEFAFRWCPAGTFMMGSPTSEKGRENDEKQHQVKLNEGFWMMETEVTLGMFRAFVSDTGYESEGNTPYGWTGLKWEQDSKYSWRNPGFSQEDNHPVTCVSWNDAVEFCNWLSKKTDLNITLPTESQWEYACRAGSTTAYFWGAALNGDKANCDGLYPCGTATKGIFLEKTTPVDSYEANAWGLYGMHGNAWEWCLDWYGDYPSGNVIDPVGPSTGSYRVFRGGAWVNHAESCRSANRNCASPENRGVGLGFRVVQGQ